MDILLLVLSGISLIVLWKIVSIWYGNRLRKDTARRRAKIEKLKKEIYKNKEMKKHLGHHDMEREEFRPDFSEEESEAKGYPSSAVMDEEDTEHEDP